MSTLSIQNVLPEAKDGDCVLDFEDQAAGSALSRERLKILEELVQACVDLLTQHYPNWRLFMKGDAEVDVSRAETSFFTLTLPSFRRSMVPDGLRQKIRLFDLTTWTPAEALFLNSLFNASVQKPAKVSYN